VLACMKKELKWEQHIELCLQSWLSKKTYCEENNLCYPLFFVINERRLKRMSSAGLFVMNLRSLICRIGAKSSTFFYRKGTEGAEFPQRGAAQRGYS
jgi:hypothetical protein